MNRRKFGLKAKLLLVIAVAAIIAAVALILMNLISSVLLDSYLSGKSFMMKKNAVYMDKFENYVSESDVEATDSSSINTWIEQWKATYLIMEISRDGKVLYDSITYSWVSSPNDEDIDQTTTDNTENDSVSTGYNAENKAWFLKRNIAFADGNARVFLYGYYDNGLYTLFAIIEIFACILIFAIVFLFFIRKKIGYIERLVNDIRILETGGLAHEIKVEGKDELGLLASSLDQMRLALADNINEEEATKQANYELVVAVSHDLRTPLTALALYLDLLREEKYTGKEQFNLYLDKSREKVVQIKQMSDRLFERFYMEKDNPPTFEQPKPASVVFGDHMSNMIGYLEVNGFMIDSRINAPDAAVTVSMDYLGRIFDNISSNIIKYADNVEPVRIILEKRDGKVVLSFSNKIKQMEAKMESTEVGVKNITVMMEKMNGMCRVSSLKNNYIIELEFPEIR